ncbi:hypothetical protein EDD85DRAFT_792332 [Armillaria nabsnona]|nr:hypothetical protein EDD85DRAFT_792332 [Armillaria nabsnona]
MVADSPSLLMSEVFDAFDFAGMAPEVLGRGTRIIHMTPRMVNHQNIVVKNVEASRKWAATTALQCGATQVMNSQPNTAPSSTFGSQGQTDLTDQSSQVAKSLSQPNHQPIQANEDAPGIPASLNLPQLNGLPALMTASSIMAPPPAPYYSNDSNHTSLSSASPTENRANSEDGATSEHEDLGTTDGPPLSLNSKLTPDIRSMPIDLSIPKTPLQCVQANEMTLMPTCPAKNLTWQSHAVKPEGSSPLPSMDKENIPSISPNLAVAAQTLGKQAAQSPVQDDVIEVPTPTENSDEGKSKGKPKRKKPKWSLRNLQLNTACQCILQGSYFHLQYLLITVDPWVVDAEADKTTIKAWFMQLDYLITNARYQGWPAPTLEEIGVIKQRRAQHHGEIKTAARLFVSHPIGEISFCFTTPMDAQSIVLNRNLVEGLKDHMAYTFCVSVPEILF